VDGAPGDAGKSCTDWNTAASGGYNSMYSSIINTYMVPNAAGTYAIRVNWEWAGCGNPYLTPYHCDGSVNIPTATWTAATCQLIDTIRSFPSLAGIPIEIDAPFDTRQQAVWPGFGSTPACSSGPINMTGADIYFQPAYDGPTSAGSWNAQLPYMSAITAWGQARGIPLAFGEWCNQYTDIPFSGDVTTSQDLVSRFTQWMKANNTVIQAYWDSNSAVPNDCTIANDPNRKAAYIAAYGSSHYTGTYFTSPPFHAFGGIPGYGY
jgi:hypothetical protein